MDLKFTFGGASPDHHDHGGAPSGIPLPFAGAASMPVSNSNVLDVVVRVDRSGDLPLVVAEVITGDGVTYSRGDVELASLDQCVEDQDFAPIAKAVRSSASRAVAGLEGPLALSVTNIELQLSGLGQGVGSGVLGALGIATDAPVVSEDLQARIGVSEGTTITVV